MGKLSKKQLHEAGWLKASKELSKLLLAEGKKVNKNAQQILVNATSSFLDYVQMNKELLPYDTANLHDSIATSVSTDGRIIRAEYMPIEATVPQTAPGRKRIIGEQEAVNAIMRFRPNKRGTYATLFVAVPYAEGANEKSSHAGFYQWLKSAFESDMSASIAMLSKYPKAKALPASRRRFK